MYPLTPHKQISQPYLSIITDLLDKLAIMLADCQDRNQGVSLKVGTLLGNGAFEPRTSQP